MRPSFYRLIATAMFIFTCYFFSSCSKDNSTPINSEAPALTTDAKSLQVLPMPRGNWVVSAQHLNRQSVAFTPELLADTAIDGCFLMIAWWQVEPTQNVFDWVALDQNLTLIANAGKDISIAVLAGQQAPPDWIFTNLGLANLKFEEFLSNGNNNAKQALMEVHEPPVWNTAYVNAFTTMINALAAHLQSEPAIYAKIKHIKITGLNRSTEEERLPFENSIKNQGGVVSTNAAAIWLAAGYRPQYVVTAGETIMDAYANAFPDKYITMETDTVAWPTINSKGKIVAFPDVNVGRQLIDYGLATYPTRFILQTDYLNNGVVTRVSRNFAAAGGLIGFQIAQSIYSTPPPTPAIDASLSQAITNGVNTGAQYVEVMINDETYYPDDMIQLHNALK